MPASIRPTLTVRNNSPVHNTNSNKKQNIISWCNEAFFKIINKCEKEAVLFMLKYQTHSSQFLDTK